MLVLSRTLNQRIIIGDDITITVVEVLGGKVRLGLTAPEGVTIHREEIYRIVQRERREGRGDR